MPMPPLPSRPPSFFRRRTTWGVVAVALVAVVAFFVFGSGPAVSSKPSIPAIRRVAVVTQSLAQSRSFRQSLSFPALLVSQEEATVVAKAPGTVQSLKANLGSPVRAGTLLATIDDPSGSSYGTGLKAGAVNQAKLASEQASSAYRLAQTTYQDLASSSEKDLQQAALLRDQAQTGNANTVSSTDESLKSGQIAYDTAKLASEQAKASLDNHLKTATQAESDAGRNASLAADTAFDVSRSTLISINSLTGLDESNSVAVPYASYLGASSSQTLIDAKSLYRQTKATLQDFATSSFATVSDRLSKTESLLREIKRLADATKLLFDNTVTGSLLPQSSFGGPSLDSLQQAVGGMQSQISGVLAQLNGARQALENTRLGNATALDAYKKGYELALQQEKAALQNLDNLKAASKAQRDQARFAQDQASSQYDSLKIKLNSGLQAAKAQMESARLQYQNSLLTLESLSGNYQLVAPIDGVLTRKFVSEGDTVAPGQALMTLSRPDRPKVQFYVDRETLPSLRSGMALRFKIGTLSVQGRISSVSGRADETTKRFLVEGEPLAATTPFTLGTVADVSIDLERTSSDASHFWLPLSAIEVGQNGNLITLAVEGRAQKTAVSVGRIEGEHAEVQANLPPDTLIVVEGNRLAQEGDFLTLK